jgi:uncharacterized membrane protein YhaH (DUF805 family)
MLQRGTTRILIALTLTAVLLSTAAPLAAQPLRDSGVSWRLGWDAVWTWARLSLGMTAKPHNKSARDAGCGIDPNGRTCE